jgi:hypothetical protein
MDGDAPHAALLAAGLRSFFRLAEEWQLSEAEQIILLGLPPDFVLDRWRRGDLVAASGETLERISHLLWIYKAIHTLLPVPERANGWMRAPNSAPLFGGRSALDRMLSGDMADLRCVRTYLDAQLG